VSSRGAAARPTPQVDQAAGARGRSTSEGRRQTSSPGALANALALHPDLPLVLAGNETLVLGARTGPSVADGVIAGPLEPGTVAESLGLRVTQTDTQHAEIVYGGSWIRIAGVPGDVYAFTIGPPIETPPKPQQQIALPGGPGFVPLLDPFTTEPVQPELPQRLVRLVSTRWIVDEHVDDDARVPPLVLQSRIAEARDIAARFPILDTFDVDEYVDGDRAQLRLERSMIVIDRGAAAETVAGEGNRARYAYWIDPEWSGPRGTEKRVVIVAAPGVTVRTGEPEHPWGYDFGRKLVAELVRVPHPGLVPAQGTRLNVEEFVGVDVVDPNAPKGILAAVAGLDGDGRHSDAVEISTGLAGVTITHPWSGARLTLQPATGLGGAYAWQVVPPVNGAPGEIRAVVGPGVEVDLAEPVPQRLRTYGGPTLTPRRGEARYGEGIEEQAFELKLVEVPDAAIVPMQGTPLNIEHFLVTGGRPREPDRHEWLGTDDTGFIIATVVADTVISLIPVVGELYAIGEFAYAASTGHDWWGQDIDDGGKVMMGVGAAFSLIPLVGGLSKLMRGAADVARVAQVAERVGMRAEEMQAVLVRVGASVQGSDAAVVQRATQAIVRGEEIAEEDVPALERVLGKVGAGGLELGSVARTGMSGVELGLATADAPLHRQTYLENLLSAVRTTGDVPDELAEPLVRSGHFGNGAEAGAAVEQALRDSARGGDVVADERLIADVAEKAGRATERVQAAGIERLAGPSRRLDVTRPELVAKYEALVDEKLPDIVKDVLKRQGKRAPTPARQRLAQLRTQFDALQAEVGGAVELTAAQRDTANTILREARDLARDDFDNVRDAVWRRLRSARQHPDLASIETELRAAGDVGASREGALALRTVRERPGGVLEESFQSMNLEHRTRLSDNPWLYNNPENLLATDVGQNQQYLETLRQRGSIWPTSTTEDFIVRHSLNDENWDFRPRTR